MMEVQKQWVNVDGKWQHIEVPQGPTIPNLPQRRPAPPPPATKQPPTLPNRSTPGDTPPPKKAPNLPSRRAEVGSDSRSPDLPLVRRGSSESMSSTTTTETFLSARSNGTSIVSNPDRFTIRAPEYDAASLPKLPPRRTQEEKDAEARVLRSPKGKKAPGLPSRPKDNLAVQPLERSKTQPPPAGAERLNLPDEVEEEETVQAPSLPKRAPIGGFQLPSVNKIKPPPPSLPRRDVQDDEAPPALPRRSATDKQIPDLPDRGVIGVKAVIASQVSRPHA